MQPLLVTRRLQLLSVDGLQFKDHDGNGRLDPYEDLRLSPLQRARDLLARMTLQEKAGAMMHANPAAEGGNGLPGAGTAWDADALQDLLLQRHVGAFLNRLQGSAAQLARQANQLQAIAERGRLGIPAMLSSDPRSHFSHSQGVSVAAGGFTQWPDPAGFGAIGDEDLVFRFGDGVRQELRAVGIRTALSPMADLVTNPRWHRCSGCFGSDPGAVRTLVQACVRGLQGGTDGPRPEGVVSVVKHWVGYGATGPEGFDAHNHYGRHLGAGTADIEDHLHPFTGAFAAGVGGVMPAYSQPRPGLRVAASNGEIESVGMGFSRQMIGQVLRGRFGFQGVVLSDWHITDDCSPACIDGAPPGLRPAAQDIAMPWGVEQLERGERFAKAIEAGVDQFGGADDPRWIVGLVQAGRLAEALLDQAVLRILVQKFQLGLFENPFVDEDRASTQLATAALQSLSLQAQRRSVVLVKHAPDLLPLRRSSRLHLHGFDEGALAAAVEAGFVVVDRPEAADVALVALTTPHELLHPNHFFGSRYREGDTGFGADDPRLAALRHIAAVVPTIASVYLERPADLARVAPLAQAIVAHFGLQPTALLDVLAGAHPPRARLPWDLPWSGPTPTPTGLAMRRGQGLHY
jgi:beta-glucosidase